MKSLKVLRLYKEVLQYNVMLNGEELINCCHRISDAIGQIKNTYYGLLLMLVITFTKGTRFKSV